MKFIPLIIALMLCSCADQPIENHCGKTVVQKSHRAWGYSALLKSQIDDPDSENIFSKVWTFEKIYVHKFDYDRLTVGAKACGSK